MSIKHSESNGSIIVSVRVVPRASMSEIIGEHDGALKVRIASPPVDGAANAELIKLFTKQFGISKGNIEIIGGQTSKSKQIRMRGLTAAQFEAVLKAKT